MEGVDVHTPKHLLEKLAGAPRLSGEHLLKTDPEKQFRAGRGDALVAEFGPMPTNFQKHHSHEIEVLDDELVVTMRDLATDVDSVTVTLCTDVAVAREQLLQRLFKTTDVEQLTFQNLTLPVQPGEPKTAKQLESIAGKCFGIPDKHVWLHPDKTGATTDKTVEKTKRKMEVAAMDEKGTPPRACFCNTKTKELPWGLPALAPAQPSTLLPSHPASHWQRLFSPSCTLFLIQSCA